ncbi:AtpZ/AtpI family protein [Pedobacter sp. BS3]|uniref:AtpZ/AtpI family protein n=1 Tax=Pedobacter sp. BS3 TaxID=2567937 RepID=UPI0011EE0B1E|nr:AtpZ/AtpI family protein [Pedobacter sp. BS3]TZF81284.1 AtpZ/AtpI family protein [Pedobacter sp. BS3]
MNMNKGDFERDRRALNSYARYSGMAFQMVAIICLFAFAGYKLDEYRKSEEPIFTAVLSLVGVIISLYIVIRSIKTNKP